MTKRWMVLSAGLLAAGAAAAAHWSYDEATDRMTDAKNRTASVASSNSLSLEFPYQGVNHGRFMVRQHPQYGLDVLLVIDKGQFQCYRMDGCVIQIRFDSGPAGRYGFVPADGGKANVVFAKSAKPLIERLKKAKTALVQVPIYGAGAQVLEFTFDTPLEWGAPSPQKKGSGK